MARTNTKKNLAGKVVGYTHRKLFLLTAASLLCLVAADRASAEGVEAKPSTNSIASTNAAVRIKYRPPSTGAPSVRLTGGSRGSGDNSIAIDVLAPNDVGLTTQEQPSLFWYQSAASKAKFELTLVQENQIKPLVQVIREGNSKPGIQRLRLSEHGGKLAPGVEYQWVVALISDPENRSSDVVASGVIKRVEASAELKKSIAAATPAGLPGVYAEAGVWYDALSVLSDRIEVEPENQTLLESRADLLRQAGLKVAVASPLAAKN